jgi:ABC-2 type transport system permease protein
LSMSVDKISRISSSIFPGTYFANYALAKPEGWDSFGMILIFIVISFIAGIILYYAGNLLYFKGVIGIGASGARGRNLTGIELDKSTVSGNAFFTYVKKDLRVLFRTPIFFMNNVLVTVLFPFFIVFPILMNSSDSGGSQISMLRELAEANAFSGDMKIASYILVGLFGFISFTCGTNGISESAISREGNCAYIMKIIPMSYKSQIWAKISVGILLSIIGAVLSLTIMTVFLQPPLWFFLVCIAVIPGAILFPNITGIIFDLYMPKIK